MAKEETEDHIGEFAERLCLLVISEATLIKPHKHGCLNKDNNGRCTRANRKRTHEASTLQATKEQESRSDHLFHWREHQLVIQCQWSSLKTCIQVTLLRLSKLYFGMYMYIHIHICMLQQWNTGHGFKRELGGIYGKVWRDEKEGRSKENIS